jgi:hypothetical protein
VGYHVEQCSKYLLLKQIFSLMGNA